MTAPKSLRDAVAEMRALRLGQAPVSSEEAYAQQRESLTGYKRPNLVVEQEEDGRWIADAPEWPGVMAYGATEEAARLAALRIWIAVVDGLAGIAR